jgi:hypothetical protein
VANETDPHATQEGPGGTPEGHTPERPAVDEFGEPGTPAAGLTPAVPHAADAEDAEEAAAHGDGHGGEHGDEPLGAVDWGAWAASLVGLAAGAVIAVAMFVGISQ